MANIQKICLLGFGEVGQALAADLLAQGPFLELCAFDKQFLVADSPAAQALQAHSGVKAALWADQAAQGCQLVISAVTAAQALAAAESVLPGLEAGAFFLELNSVSPGTKQAVADKVAAAGGRFVEASIMSPIEPKRLQAPILLGGAHAREFLPLGLQLGFAGMQFCSDALGQAAATKMCRSVMIKGMEALLTESLLSARHYGVEQTVLESLNNLFPLPNWPEHARYMISRSLEHGVRRAEEMREVCLTVSEAGIDPLMSQGCVERQAWAAQFKDALQQDDLNPMLDAIIHQNQSQE
ncbi:NAD(P)-dependent oxidoreductase [Aestuariicella hydrocarbonica]|uniref:NAD(P)-dependent oxidoreductase n=1 Tax=Pseudomaricurvus hydrocarbonicus TaxID=1470433 RepID=A0A9E5K120_9GAMM|nr:DUF1932 domain-containing protein [Aestuariicella hydrocarbonica]NHO66812.1 NAD(P)-dependent oxidoreductase [Aestuariicella hydrocarbonica]